MFKAAAVARQSKNGKNLGQFAENRPKMASAKQDFLKSCGATVFIFGARAPALIPLPITTGPSGLPRVIGLPRVSKETRSVHTMLTFGRSVLPPQNVLRRTGFGISSPRLAQGGLENWTSLATSPSESSVLRYCRPTRWHSVRVRPILSEKYLAEYLVSLQLVCSYRLAR